MGNLYPPIKPFNAFYLNVSAIHTLFVEESGNPNGKPVIFLHGGPGGGIEPIYRQYFNPDKWRIIIFDQRGCGKSIPHAELNENTTWNLINDIEIIRNYLNIKSWVVFGGSWGSTLALSYAIKHTSKCRGLILRGIFLLRQIEIDWFYQSGCSYIYPDEWEKYIAVIPENQRDELVKAYYKQLTSKNFETRIRAAKAWSNWESRTSKLIQNKKSLHQFGDDKITEAFARIECHYFINKGFFNKDDWILNNINCIKHIPNIIIQGRYDVVCPMRSAWDLHKKWENSNLLIISDAGHSMLEEGIQKKLIEYTDRFIKY
jgi:proline iminopeptidase